MEFEIHTRPTGSVVEEILSIVEDLTGEWFTADVARAARRDLLFHDVLCARVEGRIRAFIMFTSHDGAISIALMGTTPEFRGRGYGSALIDRLAVHAKALGFEEIVALTVPPTSKSVYKATVDFYRKHGFRVVKEYTELWQDGAWELRRSLSDEREQPTGWSPDGVPCCVSLALGVNAIVTLRNAGPKDSEFAYCVKKAAFREYVEKVWGWDEDEQRHLHERRFTAQDFRVIKLAGTDIGIMAVVVAPDCVKVNQLFVLPEHQGKGIGRECMLLIMQEARRLGLPVRLRVLKVNSRAQAFFQRLGFTRTAETATYHILERDS